MIKDFIILGFIRNKVVPTTYDPIKEEKIKVAKEKKELEGLFKGVKKIVGNPTVIETCKNGALLIKKGNDTQNLYISYSQYGDEKNLCFCLNCEKEKDNEIYKIRINDIVDVRLFIKEKINITTYEELYALVIKALEDKYTAKTNEQLKETLK